MYFYHTSIYLCPPFSLYEVDPHHSESPNCKDYTIYILPISKTYFKGVTFKQKKKKKLF